MRQNQRNQAFFNNNDQIEVKSGTRLDFNKKTSSNSTTNASLNISIFEKKLKQSRVDGLLHLNNCNLSSLIWPIFSPTLAYSFTNEEKFWEMQNLRSIDLSNNNITKLYPYNFEEMYEKKLENYPSININGNIIENTDGVYSLPPYSFEGWNELQILKLRSNQLENYLPITLFKHCVNLKVLDVSNNQLTHLINERENDNNLPVNSQLELRELLLSNNCLQILPNNLLQLIRNVKVLELNNNKISTLNNNLVWNLPFLTKLNLSENCLKSLPSPFPHLPLLEELKVAGNTLTNLPSLSNLPKLITFDASRNQLTEFPKLYDENKGPIPLTCLILSYNSISFIDSSIFKFANNLTELLLHNNKLSTIPQEIEFLNNLKILDISNNNLTDIPSTLGYINSLNIIKTEGNCIRSIRQNILNKSVNELKTYLRSRGPSLIQVDTYLDFVKNNNQNEFNSPSIDTSNAREALSKHKSQELNKAILNKIRMISTTSTVATAATFSSTSLSSSSTTNSDNIVYSLDFSNMSLTSLEGTIFEEEVVKHPKFDTITSINLANNSLTNIPNELGILKNSLKLVNLSSNRLNLLNSPLLFQFLNTLDLSSNNLNSNIINKILSVCISGLINLSLNNNPLSIFPIILNQGFELKILSLKNCSLSSISQLNFENLINLINLDVSNNNIKTIEYVNHTQNNVLYGGINNAINLEFLSLENNSIEYISPILSQLPKLKTLLISGNLQRIIRPIYVQQGSNKVLEILKEKYSADRDGEIIFSNSNSNSRIKNNATQDDYMNNNISTSYQYSPNDKYQSNPQNNQYNYVNNYQQNNSRHTGSSQSNSIYNNDYSQTKQSSYSSSYNTNSSYSHPGSTNVQSRPQYNNSYQNNNDKYQHNSEEYQYRSNPSPLNSQYKDKFNQSQYANSRGNYYNPYPNDSIPNSSSSTRLFNNNSSQYNANFDKSYTNKNNSISEPYYRGSKESSISSLRDNNQYDRHQANASDNRQEVTRTRRPHPSDSTFNLFG